MQPERNLLSALNNVEKTIRASDAIQADKKAELLRLLATLKFEIATLEHTHAEHVESVLGLAERSMHEALRQPKDPQLAASALQELAASVAELEVSHPQLVNVVNAISVLLSNIGI
jgi:phosphoenolpyruvate carboxylase